jgi:RNA polymerase sigma-70 factor (ECF subfamily)
MQSGAFRNMDIREVVEKCKQGDSEAWTMVVDKYSRSIYNMALNFVGNRDDASDITQDVFLKIYRNIEKFKEEKNFHSWILKISKNYCIDYWRKKKKSLYDRELEETDCQEEFTPEQKIVKDSDIRLLRKKMLSLDADLRLLLIMRDIQEYSYNEISDTLNLPLGTVKSRINRARVKLAKIYLSEGK